MITIFIISTDKRAHQVKEHFQGLVKARISVFNDYEHGLKAVFDTRPEAVFIQREMGDVSSEKVAGQIKGLLRDASPRIIVMNNGAPMADGAKKFYDDFLDFAAPEERLYSLFKEQLEKIPLLIWTAAPAPSGSAEGVVLEGEPDTEMGILPVFDFEVEPAPPVSKPVVTPAPEVAKPFSGSSPAEIPKVVASPAAPSRLAGIGKPQTALGSEAAAPQAQAVPRPVSKLPDAPKINAQAPTPKREATVADEKFPPFETIFATKTAPRRSLWFYIAGFMITVALSCVIYFLGQSGSSKSKPDSAATAPATAVKPITSLPGVIPKNGRDPAYSESHPGWERYVSDGLEFLVFKANDEIKAVQVMATRNGAVTDDFISGFLGQLLGSSLYTVSSTTNKRNYKVQHAKLAGGAELVIYRKKISGEIRGIVVSVE